MTVISHLKDFLIAHRPQPFCRECLARELGWKRRYDPELLFVAENYGYRRTSGTCSRCGKDALVLSRAY